MFVLEAGVYLLKTPNVYLSCAPVGCDVLSQARLTAGVGNDGGDGLSGSTGVDGGVDGGSSPIRGDASVPSPPSPAESGVGAAGGGPPPPPSPSRGHWSCASEVCLVCLSLVDAFRSEEWLWRSSVIRSKALPCPSRPRLCRVCLYGFPGGVSFPRLMRLFRISAFCKPADPHEFFLQRCFRGKKVTLTLNTAPVRVRVDVIGVCNLPSDEVE